ncbi:MAG: glycosyltransferase [Acidobacteria bacterium]|nr:glycosyltransferase [Acidobacteriota bacterium]
MPAIPQGKFFHIRGERFLIKGVTYGTFGPDAEGFQFPPLGRVAHDFSQMRAHGINTVRVYTVPSTAMLDEAARQGLRVMVGIPWAQHIAFLDDARLCRTIRRDVRETVRSLARHPAVLMFALGNEIPAEIVRWHGRERVEAFIRQLYDDGKSVAPDSTFTYVNFPPTEYLDLPFLDVCAFNVYLHDEAKLRSYIARLHHMAGNRPLLLAEAGADSLRHGLDEQARLTATQLRASFAEGACGAVAFAWTDEWWRGGHPIEDWAFGLVDAERRPKPALHAVSRVFAEAPFSPEAQRHWPKVSVVICAYNAASTLEDCLSSLEQMTYPDFEVIVVNDGSKDATGEIARRHPSMTLIEVPNGGLSAARNIGLAKASGEIVAYTDADVRVEPDWLTYLVQPFLTSDVVACGGPNVAPADDPWQARAVSLSPGGPTHVLLDDRVAEHVPGCNLAVRRDALLAINGFNPLYLRAGDDVDVCWRLQARGGKVGFSPAALVWHHHRPSIKAFWRQQVGYGEGEAWLRPHHPDKFVGGRVAWRGHIYSPLPFLRALTGTRIDAGVWGSAAFPSVYHPGAHPIRVAPHSAMWMGLSTLLALGGALAGLGGHSWMALVAVLLGVAGLATSIAKCAACAWATDVRSLPSVPGRSPGAGRLLVRLTMTALHLLQPIAREVGWMRGRFSTGEEAALHPLPTGLPTPSAGLGDIVRAVQTLTGRSSEQCFWGEEWTSGDAALTRLVHHLRTLRITSRLYLDDGWQLDRDISLPVFPWGWLDLRGLVEDHGGNRRLLRIGQRLRATSYGSVLALLWVVLAGLLLAGGVDSRTELLGLLCLAGVAGLLLWQVTRMLAAVRSAAVRAAADVGMQPLSAFPTADRLVELARRTRTRAGQLPVGVPQAHDNA